MNNNKFVKNKKQVLREFNKEKYFNIYNFFKKKNLYQLKMSINFFVKMKQNITDLKKKKKL